MISNLILAAVIAFAIAALAGKRVIPILRSLKAGQSIKEDGPTWHMSKQGTPTMGGIIFILGLICALDWRAVAAGELESLYVLIFALVFGAIGCIDDLAKLRRRENTGLRAPMKFFLQLAAAILFTVLLRFYGFLTPNLYVPFWGGYLLLPWWLYMAFSALVMVAVVNAVNLTDGVDGLATGVTMPVAAFFAAVAFAWGRESLGIFAAALFGALAGFLLYNFHPAKTFMGDTGALFLGGAVCGLAFALDIPLALAPIGVVYIAETLSDIIQVVYFKATHGKRIFKMAPLHHHFEMSGWSEIKVFLVFGGVSAAACLITYFGVVNKIIR